VANQELRIKIRQIESVDEGLRTKRQGPEKTGRVFTAWTSIVQLAMENSRQGLLANWGEPECLAAIRALILLAVARTPEKPVSRAATSPEAFGGISLGLWERLHDQIRQISGTHADVSHAQAQQLVLLHLHGTKVAEAVLGVTKNKDDSVNALDSFT
jgi:hypothetical protein